MQKLTKSNNMQLQLKQNMFTFQQIWRIKYVKKIYICLKKCFLICLNEF